MSKSKVEDKKVSDLIPDSQNVNVHSQRGRGIVEHSVRRYGIGRGIVAAGKGTDTPQIIGGHLTTEIVGSLDMDDVIFVHTNGEKLVVTVRDDIAPNSVEAIALGLIDNESQKQSYNPDLDILAAVMADPAMQALRDEDKILAGIVEGMGLKGETKDAEPQTDRAAELLEKWQVKTGDLWQIGEHRLICGDCTDAAVVDRVMGGEKADIGAHDPPYGIGADKKKAHSSIRDNPAWQDPKWDERTPTKDELDFIMSLSGSVAFWGGNYFANNLPASSAWLVWIKPQAESGFSLADLELCWTNKQFAARSKTANRRDGSLHPTQKPVDVITWTIEMLGDGQTVLDGYSGSGTTLVACQNLSRRGRAIEISPAYCAVTLERMSTAFPELEIKRLE